MTVNSYSSRSTPEVLRFQPIPLLIFSFTVPLTIFGLGGGEFNPPPFRFFAITQKELELGSPPLVFLS